MRVSRAAFVFLLAAAVAGCAGSSNSTRITPQLPVPNNPPAQSGPPALSNNVLDHGYTLHVVRQMTPNHTSSSVRHPLTAYIIGNLVYHGGAVEAHPVTYVVYWGWTSDPDGEQPYLNAFLNGMGSSDWLNVVTQYSSSSAGFITNPPAQLAGTWSDPTTIPAVPQTTDIVNEALRAVAHFGYNPDANYIVATPTHHSTADTGPSGQYCAWHTYASSPNGTVALTNLPYESDTTYGCGKNGVNPGAAGVLDGVSIVAGHEVAEAQTNPSGGGWYDSSGYEIADKCNATTLWANTVLSTGRFAVQELYSNALTDCAPVPPGLAINGDLYGIARTNTGSGRTEVHALDGRTFGYFSKHIATALAATGSGGDWQFLIGPFRNDGNPDLWAISKANTGSNTTELHVLSAASNYSTFLIHTATALETTGSDQAWQFALGDYNHDGNLDLFCIHRTNTGSSNTEVHILDGSNFTSFLLHVATPLPATGADGSWKFLVGPFNRDGVPDVWAVAKAYTGSNTTEVHILSAASSYTSWLYHAATGIQVTGTDNAWDFALHDFNGDGALDLYGIQRTITASGSTEVHIVDGTSFGVHLKDVGTPLQQTGADLSWEFGESS